MGPGQGRAGGNADSVHQALLSLRRVMTSRSARRRPPIVVPREPRPDRRRATHSDILDPGALEAPLPGALLVLLSRLHRAESKPIQDNDPAS